MTLSFCVPAFANDSFVAEPAVPYYFEESTAYGRNTLSIEWGGNEALVADSYSCSGRYYNDIGIPIRCSYANRYGGYSWEFDEKDSTNGNAKYIWGTVVLGLASGSLQNRQTNATLVYNHTYLVNNSVTSNYPDDWSISVEVDGITY